MSNFCRILFLWSISCVAFSQDPTADDNDNFRARCRKTISGFYADAWNEAIRAQDAAAASDKSLSKLKPQLKTAEERTRAHQRKIQDAPFNAAMAAKHDELKAQEKVLHEQIASAEELLLAAKRSHRASEQRHAALSSQIDKIFHRKLVDDPDGLPRKVFHRIDWRHPCPKYRSLCPLPAESAIHLKNLLESIDDNHGDCQKYSNLR